LQIVDTTRIELGSLPASKEHGQTFRPNETVKTRSASARVCIARAIWSNGSSTRSSNVGVWRPDTTNSRQTIWRSSSLHQSEFGCVPMSPRASSRTVSSPKSRSLHGVVAGDYHGANTHRRNSPSHPQKPLFDHALEMMTPNTDQTRILASITGAKMIEGAGGSNLTKLRQSNSRHLTRDRKFSENRYGLARAKIIICNRSRNITSLKSFNKLEKFNEQNDDLRRLFVCSTNASDADFSFPTCPRAGYHLGIRAV
jgi:hypothetical protein